MTAGFAAGLLADLQADHALGRLALPYVAGGVPGRAGSPRPGALGAAAVPGGRRRRRPGPGAVRGAGRAARRPPRVALGVVAWPDQLGPVRCRPRAVRRPHRGPAAPAGRARPGPPAPPARQEGPPMSARSQPRLFVLRVLVVALLATLLGRLVVLQVVDGPGYEAAADANRVREVVTTAPRGVVYDVAGTAVAHRPARADRVGEPGAAAAGAGPGRRRAGPVGAAGRADPGAGLRPDHPVRHPARRRQHRPRRRRLLARFALPAGAGGHRRPADEQALRRVLPIQEHAEDFPGVEAALQRRPRPPAGALGGARARATSGRSAGRRSAGTPYAGVQDTALVGRGGVEQTYERDLRGVDGRAASCSSTRTAAVTGTAGTTAPVPGDDLVLSVDAEVQRAGRAGAGAGGAGGPAAAVLPRRPLPSPTRVRSW